MKKRLPRLLTRYICLIALSFLILLPIISLISTSSKDLYDLLDPQVRWVPTSFRAGNYVRAYEALGGTSVLLSSLGIMTLTTAAQVISCMVIAYGFAGQNFPVKKAMFVLMIATFFIPQQIAYLSQYVQYSRYGLLGTIWPIVLPAAFGQGIKGSLMILLFYQFFKAIPPALNEAALIDGASLPRIMVTIDVPLVGPAMIITTALSFSWYWNDTYFTASFFKEQITTMTLSLSRVKEMYSSTYGTSTTGAVDEYFNGGIEAAAALIVIVPLILLFIALEKKLIEGIDRVGITGE